MTVKIISQSTIARSPAYFHLAYLAASHTAPARGLLSAGVLTLLLGCILSLRVVRSGAVGKRAGPIALVVRKRNPRLLVWGFVSLAAGATLVWLSYQAGQTRYSYPDSLTQMRMHMLSDQIERHLGEGEVIAEDMASLAAQWKLPRSHILDGWSKEMRLMKTTDDEGTRYGLVSAGKDREFGTGDDLLMAIPYGEEESAARI